MANIVLPVITARTFLVLRIGIISMWCQSKQQYVDLLFLFWFWSWGLLFLYKVKENSPEFHQLLGPLLPLLLKLIPSLCKAIHLFLYGIEFLNLLNYLLFSILGCQRRQYPDMFIINTHSGE